MRKRRSTLGSVAAAVMAGLSACHSASGPTTPDEARTLLRAAIAAHGGREPLARFDDFRIVSNVLFKGMAGLHRTVDYRGAARWAMSVAAQEGVLLRMGVDGTRCWKQDRYRVEACLEGEGREGSWMAVEHNAWVLHQIEEAALQPAASVRIGLRAYPAIRAGEMVLVFDPQSDRLVQVRHGDRVDALSDFRSVDGALIATHRVVTLAGEPDLEETWTAILPGGSDPRALQAPQPPAAGVIVDDTDPARPVAWTELDDPVADAAVAVQRLDEFIRRRGRSPSASDGVIWTAPDHDGTVSGARWRLAVGVEVGAPLTPVDENGLHLEVWPATRVLGVFHQRDFHAAEEQREPLVRLLQERGLVPAAGARLQILAPRNVLDQRSAQLTSLVLVRIAVQ